MAGGHGPSGSLSQSDRRPLVAGCDDSGGAPVHPGWRAGPAAFEGARGLPLPRPRPHRRVGVRAPGRHRSAQRGHGGATAAKAQPSPGRGHTGGLGSQTERERGRCARLTLTAERPARASDRSRLDAACRPDKRAYPTQTLINTSAAALTRLYFSFSPLLSSPLFPHSPRPPCPSTATTSLPPSSPFPRARRSRQSVSTRSITAHLPPRSQSPEHRRLD